MARRIAPGDGLLHAVPLGAVAVLVLNDHWWKRAYPSFVTGKLSDVAGLVFFPLLLQALWEIGRSLVGSPWGPSRRALIVAVIATGVVFALAKIWPPVNSMVRTADAVLRWLPKVVWAAVHGAPAPPLGRASLVLDRTDLLALPALLAALGIGLRRADAVTDPARPR